MSLADQACTSPRDILAIFRYIYFIVFVYFINDKMFLEKVKNQ